MIYLKNLSYMQIKKYNFNKENIDKWNFAMASMEINQEHYHFGGDFEIVLMSII